VPIILSPARPDYRQIDWVKFQASLEERPPSSPLLPIEVEIETCVEEMSSAILEALAASTVESRPRDDPQPPIPACIQKKKTPEEQAEEAW
jgi:hypothetical protein